MACGFNKETVAANITCFFGVILSVEACVWVLLDQIVHPIYNKNRIPETMIPSLRVCKVAIKADTPETAKRINRVSHTPAVATAGILRKKFGCCAPWLKIKTFCTPNGNISPNAKITPCIRAFSKQNQLLNIIGGKKMYTSQIRSKNSDRKNVNTTLSQSLYQEIKLLAKKLDRPANELIEEGMVHVLNQYKKNK
jgi:hypothetical protein